MKRSIFVILLVSSLVFLAQCRASGKPDRDETANMLVKIEGITEPSVAPPCQNGQWKGLSFGKTTETEFAQWLSTSTTVDVSSLYDTWREQMYDNPSHVYTWLLSTTSNDVAIIEILDGVVYAFAAPIMYPLNVSQMLEWLGEPSYVSGYYECRTLEDCLYTYNFYYLELGIGVSGQFVKANFPQDVEIDSVTGEEYGPLEGTFPVDYLFCGATGDLGTLIGHIYVTKSDKVIDAVSQRFYAWEGLSRIKLFTP